jgi:Flp pilus assembly protein TadG
LLPDLLFGQEAAELVEFALVLPFVLVIAIAIIDFGRAYNLKQIMNNAARDGARFAASQSSNFADLSDTSCSSGPASVCAIRDVVQNYVTNARVTSTCTLDTGPTAGTFPQWTFTSSACSGYQLKIERAYNFTFTSGGTNTLAAATRVTLQFPFRWSITGLMRLLVPGTTMTAPATISSFAIIENLN